MKQFHRKRDLILTRMTDYEVDLLSSLVRQLVELVSDGEPSGLGRERPGGDTFDELVADLRRAADEPEAPDDPVLRRLFPDAYPDDPAASSDFRRFTERDLRSVKVADAQVVLDGLAATERGQRDLRITRTQTQAWLRTLTSVRLAVAARLGIVDAASAEVLGAVGEDDPRSYLVSVYDWLGFAQETLVNAL